MTGILASGWTLLLVFWAGGCAGMLVASLMHMSNYGSAEDRGE